MTSHHQNILLIPVYNPEKDWHHAFLAGYNDFITLLDQPLKVVLINDGSTIDLEKELIQIKNKLGTNFEYLSYPENKGKGGALKYGLEKNVGESYMFTDIDFPYTSDSMIAVWNSLQFEKGIVTGHRLSEYYGDLTWIRKIMSRGLRFLNKTIMGLPIDDTQCGLKAFDNEVANIFKSCETNRFLIDLELLLAASKAKKKITPVNVYLRPDIDFTKFNSAVLFKELFNLFNLIFKYRII